MNQTRLAALLFLSAATAALVLLAAPASSAKIDVAADTYHIVDGDTIDAFPVGRIRFADIDAPESGQPGYSAAKDAVRNYTENKRVYLDVDDVGVDDSYNRIVAVVYVRYNSTHLINVNRALVDAGLANESDFPNEFDPATWPLYVRLSGTELPTLWGDGQAAYGGALRNLSIAQDALDTTEGDLAEAVAARDAALAEVERLKGFLNGTLPAEGETLAALAQAKSDLEATEADLEGAAGEIASLREELNATRATLAGAQAQGAADREALEAEVAAANGAAALATAAGAVGLAGAAVGAFTLGRRPKSP